MTGGGRKTSAALLLAALALAAPAPWMSQTYQGIVVVILFVGIVAFFAAR